LSMNENADMTIKKNQPVLFAELDQVLVALKKNEPMISAQLAQLIVDVKQLLVALAGNIGIM